MRSQKLSLFIGVVFVAFIGAFGTYQYQQQSDRPNRSSDSIGKSKTGRIENSKITKTENNIENEPSALFNDPAINQNWGLKKSDAARAWSVSHGSKDIVVAVIDTGADIYHEDLDTNIWVNPGESGLDANGKDKSKNGIDDDGNGFIDDVHGWNFVSNNNSLTDNHGHGTHISCIIGAKAGNGKGISGVSPDVSLMILKYYDPKVPGTDNLKNTVASIKYAVKMGADIINYSGGGTEFSQEEHDAIVEAQKKGILFVAAAGNERSNSDQFHYYPADYGLSNIISVTAIDPSTDVLSSSNYGTETVDIAAPGQNILSCLPGNAYGYMTGTSQATAFVSGAGALVKARHGADYKAEDMKKYILATGDAQPSLLAKTRTNRALNLYKAITMLDQGTNLTGTKVVDQRSNEFTSDPNMKKPTDGASEGIKFGKDLIQMMDKSGRLGGKQNPPQEF